MAKVSPTALAKKLGVRPQQIYGLIKKGEIDTYPGDNGKIAIDEVQATNRLTGGQKRKGRKTKRGVELRVPPPVKNGTTLGWSTKDGRKVAVVHSQDEYLNYLRSSLDQELFFRHGSLKKLLDEGKVAVEQPWTLVDILIQQWNITGRENIAGSLQEWSQIYRPADEERIREEAEKEALIQADLRRLQENLLRETEEREKSLRPTQVVRVATKPVLPTRRYKLRPNVASKPSS